MSYSSRAALLANAHEETNNTPKTKKIKKPASLKTEHLGIKSIEALNEPQRQMMHAFSQGLNVVAVGSAGTGKSYISAYLALQALFNKEISKIVIVRSAVPTRDMGFLPGTLQEKSEVYTIPYKQIFNDLCMSGTAWDVLQKKGLVEFITTSFIRGITIEDSVVILDETQSWTFHEIDTVVTRSGYNTRLLVCGDSKQNDLANSKREKSGLDSFVSITQTMPTFFDTVQFTRNDIVRSALVKAWIIAKEDLDL